MVGEGEWGTKLGYDIRSLKITQGYVACEPFEAVTERHALEKLMGYLKIKTMLILF